MNFPGSCSITKEGGVELGSDNMCKQLRGYTVGCHGVFSQESGLAKVMSMDARAFSLDANAGVVTMECVGPSLLSAFS